MSKTIQVEYTNPVTGAEAMIQVSVDVDRYRKDSEAGPVENFFIKASGSGKSDILVNVDDIVANLIDGRPSHAQHDKVQTYVKTGVSAGATSLECVDADLVALGFLDDKTPCVVLDKYGDVKTWFVPASIATDTFTIPTANEGALQADVKKGWIVQRGIPFASSLGENSQLGIKAQAEQPTTPTGVAGVDTGSSSHHITAHFTKPSDVVIAYYDIYCFKTATQPLVIEPNDLPTVADRAASAASTAIAITEYFDESIMELVAMDAGTYFIGVVAKDGSGKVDVNESAIGWSVAIVVA